METYYILHSIII